jgi:hypothetical protein
MEEQALAVIGLMFQEEMVAETLAGAVVPACTITEIIEVAMVALALL